MRPLLHPRLVNGRFGDPALFVETLHQRGALLFDIGDLSPLSARDLLRIGHVFVTHMHIDHFIGFDALLRVSVGRDKRIAMVGPAGFAAHVHHKLQGYAWDLVHRYQADLVFDVLELIEPERGRRTRFRFKTGFRPEDEAELDVPGGVVAREPGFEVRAAILEHHGPCLCFAVKEPAHVNVWKNRLAERGLPTGQWLQALKLAVTQGQPDGSIIDLPGGRSAALGELRDLVTVTTGQKIAYATDLADTEANRSILADLASEADTLFVEARFAAADAKRARERAHLTTEASGEIARRAGVRRVEPFHFSPLYEGEEERMVGEVLAVFQR